MTRISEGDNRKNIEQNVTLLRLWLKHDQQLYTFFHMKTFENEPEGHEVQLMYPNFLNQFLFAHMV